MKITKRIRFVTHSAIIAAIYVVLTYVTNFLGLASGVVQCRLSEAMCILPGFTPAAVPGLFIGCLLSNLLTGSIILDVIFGSFATLLGAYFTLVLASKKANPYTFPIPAIVANSVIIPLVLKFAYGFEGSVWFFVLTVGLGEIISCGILGMLLYFSLKKKANNLFLK